MSDFNALLFLEATISEALTSRPALPVGEYVGIIQPFGEKAISTGIMSKGERAGQTWYSLGIRIEIDLTQYPEAMQACGTSKVTIFDGVFLDMTPQGTLDTGKDKNRRLKAYREALGQNRDGQPWAIRMMQGQPVRVSIVHTPREDGSIREDVKGVAAV